MIKVTNIQATRLIGALLILLSGNAFAVTYATQPALNTEISNRKTGDSTEKARATKAELTLIKDIATEKTRAKAAEGALKAVYTAETARATKAEGTLTTAIATETARAKAAEAPILTVGESYQGGIIFWVDQTGQHGLIAALADQSTGVQWYNGIYRSTGSTGDGIGAGAMNTAMIVATQIGDNQSGIFAAEYAADFSVQDDGTTACTGAVTETCYGDWYLPSKFELNLLYNQQSVVGGFTGANYWSSTELNYLDAWFQYWTFDDQGAYTKNITTGMSVRAVRAF